MKIKVRTFDLSGMGGGYEDQCQRMLWRGIHYLDEKNPPKEMWKKTTQYENIVGVMITEGDDLKALEKAIIHEGDDCTGAMHQCVMNHIAYIHKQGFDKWFAEMSKHRVDEEPMQWEGEI